MKMTESEVIAEVVHSHIVVWCPRPWLIRFSWLKEPDVKLKIHEELGKLWRAP